MASSKRTRNSHGENSTFTFVDCSLPAPKRPRRVTQSVSLADIWNLQQERANTIVGDEVLENSLRKAAAEKQAAEVKLRVGQVLRSVTAAGYDSLFGFMDELPHISDQQISAQVSRMLGHHGEKILNGIHIRQPNLVSQWAVDVSSEILATEGWMLTDYLRPAQGSEVSSILQNFSLDRIMAN